MKNLVFILFLFLGQEVSAQDFIGLLQSNAFNKLETHLNTTVNIEIRRKKSTVSKTKAIGLLRAHLEEFKPVKWEVMHKGNNEESNDKYVIANIYNAEENGIRMFMHVESINGKSKVSSIRIRKLL